MFVAYICCSDASQNSESIFPKCVCVAHGTFNEVKRITLIMRWEVAYDNIRGYLRLIPLTFHRCKVRMEGLLMLYNSCVNAYLNEIFYLFFLLDETIIAILIRCWWHFFSYIHRQQYHMYINFIRNFNCKILYFIWHLCVLLFCFLKFL